MGSARLALSRWVVAAVGGALGLATIEWLLLVVESRDLFASPAQMARMLPLGVGNLLGYALLGSAVLVLADVGERVARGRLRWPRALVTALGALAAAPYAAWLAPAVFSGPRASTMPYRAVWVAACGVGIALTFGAAAWLAATRSRTSRARAPVTLALLGTLAVVAWVGRNAYSNEYEELHGFLAVWGLLLATLAARELIDRPARRLAGASRVLLPVAILLALVGGAAASALLARRQGDASLIWRETGASRYLTHRWLFLAPARRPVPEGPAMNVKPDLESPRTAAERKRRARQPAPDIILFSVDGLRADHVGAYGYTRHPTTPNIDRLAARGVRFTNAFSSHPATQAFNSSVLLGRYLTLAKRDQQPAGFRRTAITRLLDQRDYHVFVKSWFEASTRDSFDPGVYAFDTYIPKSNDKNELEGPLDEWLSRLKTHLQEADARDQPVFVWMHLLLTHPVPGGAFEPHPDFRFGDSRMDEYDSTIAATDMWLSHVQQALEARDDDRPAIWIIASDHGTNTRKPSRDLYDGVVRVPLIVVAPDVAPRTEPALVDASLDLAATVVDLAGIAPPASYDGVSLVPLLLGEDAAPMRRRLVPLSYRKLSGAVYDGFKTIQDRESLLLFDLGKDPAERRNLVDERPDLAGPMTDVAAAELARRRDAARRAGRSK